MSNRMMTRTPTSTSHTKAELMPSGPRRRAAAARRENPPASFADRLTSAGVSVIDQPPVFRVLTTKTRSRQPRSPTERSWIALSGCRVTQAASGRQHDDQRRQREHEDGADLIVLGPGQDGGRKALREVDALVDEDRDHQACLRVIERPGDDHREAHRADQEYGDAGQSESAVRRSEDRCEVLRNMPSGPQHAKDQGAHQWTPPQLQPG